jgi:putative transcriptional regulator
VYLPCGNGTEIIMRIRILDILKEKGKTKYWLYIQLGLSYQNFNKIVNNETKSIKFDNLKAICDILECTPNDLFDEYYQNDKTHSS